MQFLADMGVSMRVVDWLRQQGHDASHLREQGLHRLPDNDIFAKTLNEQRILLTYDLDFAEIVALSGRQRVSVIVFRLSNTRSAHAIERLEHVLNESAAALENGAMISVQEHRHRVRLLPIGRQP